eukprot:TRINITY_DN78348_c0_g1_i1.p1 TRINITY_DN78348_c0_g1~~TRINITY_DN78348_c0_g1_i1.p1  ORF type:complete len:350 (-),score=104.77 TRINITY_DN78348_c0_g1_i1:41-1090(-)
MSVKRTLLSLSTSVASSSLGQKVLSKHFGDLGESLMNNLSGSLQIYYGESDGRAVVGNLLGMILQISILVDEGVLTSVHLQPSAESLRQVATVLSDACLRKTRQEDDVKEVTGAVNELMVKLDACLEKHLKKETRGAFKDTVDSITDGSFLESLLSLDEYESYRKEIGVCLAMMLNRMNIAKQQKEAESSDEKGFSQEQKAALEKYGDMKDKPDFNAFMKEPFLKVYFVEFMTRVDLMKLLQFLQLVDDYRATGNKDGRLRKANIICKKFLEAGAASYLSEQVISLDSRAKISDAVDDVQSKPPSQRTGPRPNLFDQSVKEVTAFMENIFNIEFSQSPEFRRFQNGEKC